MIYFVTPAWQRPELTAVCLEQRRRAIAALAELGQEARCVVVADDENLETARALGFDTVERDNRHLGRRFNDGIEYACRQGADWVVPVGSDSWVDPAYFADPPQDTDVVRTATLLCVVAARRLAHLEVSPNNGAGPYMIHRSLLETSRFRPALDAARKGVDRSTIDGLGAEPRWEVRDLHRLQHVSFRGRPFIHSYAALQRRWGVAEESSPWEVLAGRFDSDLVDQAHRALVPMRPIRGRRNAGRRK